MIHSHIAICDMLHYQFFRNKIIRDMFYTTSFKSFFLNSMHSRTLSHRLGWWEYHLLKIEQVRAISSLLQSSWFLTLKRT
uniref:Putative ovule protein n=1 Tax=Solanum chacoense TaxID=4108 RepID=A0A0V0H3I8_SOLCH